MSDSKIIGKNIKRLREQNGIYQEELAAKLGVTQKAVSAWENGKACPRMGAIERMKHIFNCSIYDIIDDFNEKPAPTLLERYPANEGYSTPEPTKTEIRLKLDDEKLCAMFSLLTPSEKSDVFNYMISIVAKRS